MSANQRFLVSQDDSPFFYLADTAWSLFSRLTREEAEYYLEDRAAKGFTVIQAVILWSLKANAYGDRPLVEDDPTRPDEAFFRHVDYVVERAESLGLRIGLLPAWGNLVVGRGGPRRFDVDSAHAFGAFLGRRYGKRPVIWILGGDENAAGFEAVWRAMARGIAIGVAGADDQNRVLMTYHPRGHSHSSRWFHLEPWLDFNMIQSAHCRNAESYRRISNDYRLSPSKPTMDGEPRYENIPSCLSDAVHAIPERLRDRFMGALALLNSWLERRFGFVDPARAPFAASPRITAWDVRKAAYWSVFAGAHGHTYGAAEVFAFWERGDANPFGWHENDWRAALGYPGASQMIQLRLLIESRPPLLRIPDQSLIVSDPGRGDDRVQATRDARGRYAFLYVSSGGPVTVDLAKVGRSAVRGYWYDPRHGTAELVGEFANSGPREFSAPSRGDGNDWVLILDDASQQYAPPTVP